MVNILGFAGGPSVLQPLTSTFAKAIHLHVVCGSFSMVPRADGARQSQREVGSGPCPPSQSRSWAGGGGRGPQSFERGSGLKLQGVLPWLVQLSGLSAGLQTKGSPVGFPVRAHAWVAGQVPSGGGL